MSTESTSLFKVFRVLWIPVSINAMFLGALAALLFTCATSIGVFFAGGTFGMVAPASKAFFSASGRLLTTGQWPGFEPILEGERIVRAGLFETTPPAGVLAASAADIEFTRAAFGEWIDDERALAREQARPAAEQEALDDRLAYATSRYRAIYAIQLLGFFAILATVGVAICRVLALRVTRDEYCTMREALLFAWRVKWTGLLFPPAVLVPIALLWACNSLAGGLLGIPYIGWILGIIAVPLLYLSSLLIFLVGTAGLASLTLIPAAIAVERKSTYDSIGKTVNYVFARPLPLILYLVMTALFIAFLHRMLLDHQIVERLLTQSVDPFWTGQEFRDMLVGRLSRLSGFAWFCGLFYAVIHALWQLLVWGMLIAFTAGASVSVFLILRREVDGLDYADLALDGQAS